MLSSLAKSLRDFGGKRNFSPFPVVWFPLPSAVSMGWLSPNHSHLPVTLRQWNSHSGYQCWFSNTKLSSTTQHTLGIGNRLGYLGTKAITEVLGGTGQVVWYPCAWLQNPVT